MNKVIKGKRYDTNTAKAVVTYSADCPASDFSYYRETLYQKRTGEFFLHGRGNSASKYAESCGQNSWMSGEEIVPITTAKAQEWVEKHFDADIYEKIFGKVEEEKTALKLSLDTTTVADLKRIAVAKNMTASELVARLIEHYAKTPQGEDFLA